MERSCYRCNASIAEDAPFCAACGAPQIKVPSQVEPEAQDIGAETPSQPDMQSSAVPAALPTEIQRKVFLRAVWPIAVLAGLGAAFSPAIAFLLLLPASVFAGIWLYTRRQGGRLLAGQGARLGLTMGMLSFTVFAAFTVAVISSSAVVRQEVMRRVSEAVSRTPDPQGQQLVLSLIQTPQGFAAFIGLLLFFTLMIFLVVTALTGAVAAATFGHKKP